MMYLVYYVYSYTTLVYYVYSMKSFFLFIFFNCITRQPEFALSLKLFVVCIMLISLSEKKINIDHDFHRQINFNPLFFCSICATSYIFILIVPFDQFY